jgi:hypothetical protein
MSKVTLISGTPMASLIRIGSHATVPAPFDAPYQQPPSEHYNAVCDGTFASVLGLDHQQLVDEAVAEKAKTSPPLH